MADENKEDLSCDIVIAGMGGQGSILASYLLAEAAIVDNLPVLTTGDYGMAQRGGMVTTHLRLGPEPQAQRIPLGGADVLIGCAPSEALRNIGMLSETGIVIMDTLVHVPIPVYIDPDLSYPTIDEIKTEFTKHFEKVFTLNASEIADEFGNPRVMNTVLLGAGIASGQIPIKRAAIMKAIETQMRPDIQQINIDAFERGEEEMIKLL
jgi:indolepyruvate ferredoxin oxidoreductase beta subunit